MEAAVNCLPGEILEMIFSYCTHSDLVQSVQNVCCRWREVALSTRVWKSVTYCPNVITRSEQVVEMLKISPKLQNITLQNNYDDRVLQAVTDNCAELRKLEIIGCADLDLKFLKNLQEKCPKIQYLEIPHPVFTDLDKCEVVAKFTNLKVLHLTGDQFTDSSIKFKPIADHCKELQDLEVGNNNFEINDLRYLLTMRRDTLHTVGVYCCNESGECVLPALSTCELKSLSLFNYCHCQRHYEKIEHFGRLKTVRALSITTFHSYDESDDLKQIFENGNMAQLVELTIEGSDYFDDNVTSVIVRNCHLLKCLSLIQCKKMTDASFEIMTNLKELKCLRIMSCILGLGNISMLSTLQALNLEWQDLAEFPWEVIPHHMQYLQCLHIKLCRNVNMCAIEKLKKLLPCLKVEVLGCL